MRKLLFVGVAVALLAGCGGGGGGGAKEAASPGSASPGGASVAPISAPFIVRLDTTFDSSQWTAFDALLKKFPDGTKLYSSLGGSGVDFETDVKPALGAETDVLALTAADLSKNVFVGLTQPDDTAKLDALLAKAKPPRVSEQVDGWSAVADSQATLDGFKRARNEGVLSGSAAYKDASAGLPADALASLFADGSVLTSAIDKRANLGTSIPGVGKLAWVSGALTVKDQGLALDIRVKGDKLSASSFTPELPGQVPADVSLLVDFSGLDTALQQLMQSPALKQQLDAAAGALGGIVDEVTSLFKGEGALYVRPHSGSPEYTLVLTVSDESAARATLDKLATLVGALSQKVPESVTIAGVDAKKIALGNLSLYYAVFDGKLVLTTAESGIEGLKDGSERLADSQAWKDAAEAAGMPDSMAGLFYGDIQALVPLVQSLSKSSGGSSTQIPDQVMRNLAPLGTALVFGSVDGNVADLKGYLSVR